jgi:putative chitinase
VIDANTLAQGTNIPLERAERWADHLGAAMQAFDIDSPLRRAAFVAQCAHESAFFKRWVEDLTYSTAQGIRSTFGSRAFSTVNAAQMYVRNPELLANYVYADVNRSPTSRLGNTEPGDGWKYRGRGLIQLTGRYNYGRASEALEQDFVANPELLTELHWAAMSAGWYWEDHGCNEAADSGDIDQVTKLINPAMLHRAERERIFRDMLEVVIA